MATYPREGWKHLGELLVARRVQIDAKYHNRREFARDVQVDYRVIYDAETARRTNFGKAMLRALENAYRLRTGAFEDYLSGRSIDLAGTPPDQMPDVHDTEAELDTGNTALKRFAQQMMAAQEARMQARLDEELAEWDRRIGVLERDNAALKDKVRQLEPRESDSDHRRRGVG